MTELLVCVTIDEMKGGGRMALHWNAPVTAVRGIGEKKASLYRRLGITRVEELVRHLPRDYIDRTRVCDLA